MTSQPTAPIPSRRAALAGAAAGTAALATGELLAAICPAPRAR